MLRRTFTLGRYNCVERLQIGPLGETWRAKCYGPAGLEGQFALERLHGHLAQDSAFLARLTPLLERYRAIEHPGLARLCDIGQKGPQHFLVFELVGGGSLVRLRPALLHALGPESRPLLPAVVSLIGRELLAVVESAHQQGARCPGLSSATVFVDGHGRLRVLDLGLAEARLQGDFRAAPEMGPLLPYLAPEILRGEAPEPRGDLFSVGAVLLELLTGAPPPSGAALSAPGALRPGGRIVPSDLAAPSLAQALGRALQPRLTDRPPSAAALAELLAAPEQEGEARALLARLGPRLGRPEPDPLAGEPQRGADPLPPPPEERIIVASSAESTRRREEILREAVVLTPPAGLQSLPIAASLALAPRQLAGVVLAVEEEEHTIPVPHSPKSKIRIIEAEPPGSRVGLGASLRDPEPTPIRHRSGQSPGAEITAVPGMSSTSPGDDPLRGGPADLWSVPGMSETDPGSGPTSIGAAVPPARVIPGRGAASAETPGIAAELLTDFDEPTALGDYGGGDLAEPSPLLSAADPSGSALPLPRIGRAGEGPAGAAPSAGPATEPSAISWDMPSAPPAPSRPSLADQFPPLITDPVPRIAPEEVDAEVPFAGAAPLEERGPPGSGSSAPSVLSLPSLSKDDDSLDDLLEEDEPTGSIPDAPARRLVERLQADAAPPPLPVAPSRDTGPGALSSWAPPGPAPSAPPAEAVPGPGVPAPFASPAALAAAPPPSLLTATTAPAPVVSAPPAPVPAVTAGRPAVSPRVVSPAVVISFAAALLAGGSVPVLYRLLRRPPPAPSSSARATVRTPAPGARTPAPPTEPAAPPAPAPAPLPAPPPEAGSLALASTPPGAAVFVDGKPAGRTPVTLSLGAGRHRLLLLGDRHLLYQKEVQAGAPLAVKLQPAALPAGVAGPGGLKVRCTTKGQLRIFVDGHDTGYNCPTERINLSPGPHKIEFFRPRTGDTVARPIVVKKGRNSSTRLYTKL